MQNIMKQVTWIAVALVNSLIGLACTHSNPTEDNRMGSAIGVAAKGAIRLSIAFPSEVRAGTSLPVVLRVTNIAREPATFYYGGFPDRVYYDVVVTRADGAVVWNRSHGQTRLRRLSSRQLAPGETIELSDRWELKDNAGNSILLGSYRLHGALPGSEPILRTEPETVTVIP